MKLRAEFLLVFYLSFLYFSPASSNKTGRSRSHSHHHHKKLPLLRRSRIDYLLEEPDAELRRQYKLEDFLWTGSGEGPTPVDSHDGMAWEDELIHPSGTPAIKVTKTMVLYKTVLSTVYPIAMTPVVITSNPYSTPALQSIGPTTIKPSLSSDEFPATLSTPALSSAVVQPTILPTPAQGASSGSEEDSLDNHYQDHLSAASTDLRYWIQTVLKAKDEQKNVHPNDMSFQESMQRKLATVYAAAFKRQLLQTLGVTRSKNQDNRKNETYQKMTSTLNSTSRNRRSPIATKTAMNVTVAMMNVSWTDPINNITLKYVVYAEGSPIPGFVAVKELNAVNVYEMERKLGYKVITKAEALVKPIETKEMGLGLSPTLYLAGLLIMVFSMTVILGITLYMVWKWKYNRLRSTVGSSPSHAERGTMRSEELSDERRNYQQSSLERRASIRSPVSSQFRQMRHVQQPKPTTVIDSQPGSAASDQQLVTSDDKDFSPVIRGRLGRSSPQRSPTRYKLRHGGASRKVSKRKRRKTKLQGLQKGDDEDNSQCSAGNVDTKESANANGARGQDFSLTTDLCRNLDKISYGNLEISLEPIARVPSAHAKKIIDSRPSSHEKLRASKRGEYSGHNDSRTVDAHFLHDPVTKPEQDDDGRESIHEQDRDLSEKSFEIADLDVLDTASSTQDAQVQTPTRLVKKSPRVRTTSRLKSPTKPSKISLVSTESEEATEFYHLNQSGDELNPLGKMRKRFHQFLDDAFNVMASGKKEGRVDKPQSATVTVSHKLKTKTPGRPWTSHVIREESVRKVRPKSSVVIGPPKSAWTDGSLRRCQSAKSKGSNLEEQDGGGGGDDEEYEILDEKCNPSPFSSRSPLPSATLAEVRQHAVPDSSKTFFFPKYPAYPEICLEDDPNRTRNPQSNRCPRTGLLPTDPATPLIAAIKDEMKRFERVKVSSSRVPDS